MMTFDVDNLTDMSDRLHQFEEYLRGCGLTEDDVFFSRLVGCELLTNAIRHCGSTARFCGGVDGSDIVISVSSEGAKAFCIRRNLPDILAESGRGLCIVNVVCDGNISLDGDAITAKIKINGTII